MLPTPMPFSNFGELSSGLTNAIGVDPLLTIMLIASAIAGTAFYFLRNARKVTK